MTIPASIQQLDPGKIVELFIVDMTRLGGSVLRIHPGTDLGRNPVVFQTFTYSPFPIEASGFEYSGRGSSPRPKVTIANVGQMMGDLNRQYADLVGAKFTRKRTYAKYLDGQPGADSTAEFPLDVYYVERKTAENRIAVSYELVGIWDLEGVTLPNRQIVPNVCTWAYRSGDCPYAGGAVAKADDTPTSDINLDVCGKRIASCKLRFGATAELPYGGFPGAGRFSV